MFDCWSKKNGSTNFSSAKTPSEEIESQYNQIKLLLAEPERYRDAPNAIKKDIAYMPIELKKNLRKKILTFEWI